MNPEISAPAPWQLTGHGYILLYKFPAAFGEKASVYGPYQGGFGAVMLVDYAESNVGSYYELLLVPGRVQLPQKTGYSISQIVVSSETSVINGRANWGIPKYQADFDWRSDGAVDHIHVQQQGNTLVKAALRGYGPRFPLTAAILPPIVQTWKGQTFITRLRASGKGQLAKVNALNVDAAHFPPFDQSRPLLAIKALDFNLTFPIPEIIP